MSKTFTAEYTGTCNSGGDRIRRGELICYDSDNKVSHPNCIESETNSTTSKACERCFTIHVGECL